MASVPLIRAAGTVVMRGAGQKREVLLVHRNLRNDWSLPKGKLERDELMPVAAVRETLEEAAVAVTLRQPITSIRYSSLGRPKLVRYWLAVPSDPAIANGMQDYAEQWQPNEEVDEIVWLRVDRARVRLTYRQDVNVLERALGLSEHTSPMVLMRHAEAEKRAAFALRHGGTPPHDHERPLTDDGTALTAQLAEVLRAYGVQSAFSSPARRCLDTLSPHFAHPGDVQWEPEISEFGFVANPRLAAQRTVELLNEPNPLVVACHRPVLPTMVRAISRAADIDEPSPKLKPGQFLVFHRGLKPNGRLRPNSVLAIEGSSDQ